MVDDASQEGLMVNTMRCYGYGMATCYAMVAVELRALVIEAQEMCVAASE